MLGILAQSWMTAARQTPGTESRNLTEEDRRWLREASTHLSRYIREFDAGETVYAGKKRWFQQIYTDCVRARKPFDGILQARQEFEVYRKTGQNLVGSMQGAYQSASQDGERRAQNVLTRIAGKIRVEKTRQTRR